jgi:lycopene beta-cyclase
MDFGRATGPVPRFLYAMDLGGGVGLVEHTVLAARPAVPVATLAAELAAELALAGLGVAPGAEREAVWIDMDPPVPGYTSGPVVPFGAAAGFVHPATGYSLATSLRRAAPLAEALARSVRQGRNGTDAASAALEAIWPRQARVTRALQRYGQGVLLRLDATGTRTFFDRFFDLDVDDQAAYLSTETSPGRLAGAMAAMFRHSPWPLRVTLATQGRRRRR